MKFILAKKLGMTQVYDQDGKIRDVTVLEAGPVYVTEIKSKEKDAYEAVQVGFGQTKKNKKPVAGKLKKLNLENRDAEKIKYLREFRLAKGKGLDQELKVGDKLDVSQFEIGDKVKVTAISKAKGFQGVVKRHGFKGGPKSHGNKHSLRAPGSIGVTDLQHVVKGRKMAGRMGGRQITVKNLEVRGVDKEENLLLVQGAVPGKKGELVKIVSF